jgi:phage baseplate assembly protein W
LLQAIDRQAHDEMTKSKIRGGTMTNPIIGCGWHFPPRLDERGTIALTSDSDEIEQAIQIILGTAPGQRVMRPEFGCRIHDLVFAPNDLGTAGKVARYVREALRRWEPRITVNQVEVGPDPNNPACLLIDIKYRVTTTHSNRSLVYPFYLIPEEVQAEREPELSDQPTLVG